MMLAGKMFRISTGKLCSMVGVVAILFASSYPISVDAVIPTANLNIRLGDEISTDLLVSQAFYGPPAPPFQTKSSSDNSKDDYRQNLVSAPQQNSLLCLHPDDIVIDQNTVETTKGSWMIVPRGGCTYEHKTWVAQTVYETSGVIIYNTLASRYTFNETADDDGSASTTLWPLEFHDYDCDNAMAVISSNELHFYSNRNEAMQDGKPAGTGPYDWGENDPLLSGDTVDNLCKVHDTSNLQNCPSKRCLVAQNKTNNDDKTDDTTTVCCAWDTLLNPYPDTDLEKNITIGIPTIFATMEQGDVLRKAIEKVKQSSKQRISVTVSVHSLWRPTYNISAILIVLLGVVVAGYAAFRSADDYHVAISKLWLQRNESDAASHSINRNPSSAVCDSGRNDNNQRQESLVTRSNSLADESLQLEPVHALFFLVMSSISLFILFFFKIYNVAKIMYAFGCSNSFIQVLVYPLLSRILNSRFCGRGSSLGKHCFRERILYRTEEFGNITNWDILAGVIGYSVGFIWLYMALCIPKAGDNYTFYWLAQDLLGFCMCVTFLGLIQLNSIQVAAVLLIVAFFYDIFFVFVTPYLFKGRSVMIEVATSGGPPKADALWCEKYPSDKDCFGGDPMPMLFSIPRFFDYQGGASMLGLGDIVLPGLLLSFAARLDAAKLVYTLYSATKKNDRTISPSRVDGATQQEDIASPLPPPMTAWYALLLGGHGYYFIPLMISYAVGLFMANAAVYLTNMGQPALLYIVPCTLLTMTYKGWKRSELMSLWKDSTTLKQADVVCYGFPSSTQGDTVAENTEIDEHNETDENCVDDVGDVPLLSSNSNTKN